MITNILKMFWSRSAKGQHQVKTEECLNTKCARWDNNLQTFETLNENLKQKVTQGIPKKGVHT